MSGITRVELRPHGLALLQPVVTARGTLSARPGLHVLIHGGLLAGVGELTPLPVAGTEDLEEARAFLAHETSPLVGMRVTDALHWVEQQVPARLPATRLALETALLDLRGRSEGVPLCALLGRVERVSVPLSALLAGDMEDAARAALRSGYRVVKLKVGTGDDVQRVERLRHVVGPDVGIRLDANRAWTLDQASSVLWRAAQFHVELCEDPLRDPTAEDLAALRERTGIRVGADEYLADARLRRDIVEARAVDVLVIKPAVLGGLRASLALVQHARAHGIASLVTSLLDGAVSRAAGAHLAACLPGPMPHAGLATGALVTGDLPHDPLQPRRGVIHVPPVPGHGVRLP